MDFRAALDRLNRHRLLVGVILTVGLVLIVLTIAQTPARYVAQATILMVAEPPDQNPAVPSSAAKPVLTGDLPALVASTNVMARAARDVGSNLAPEAFGRSVRAKIDGANIMPVQFTGSSPANAIAGANAVADEFTAYYRELATSRFDSLAADLRSQLKDVGASLRAQDEALARAAAQYPYVDTGANGDTSAASAYARLVALETERDNAAAAAAGSSELARITSSILTSLGPLARSEIGERDPRYRNLRDQYARDLAEYEQVRARYAPSYPGLPELASIVAREHDAVARARARTYGAPLAESPAYAQALSDAKKAKAIAASDQGKLKALDAQVAALEAAVARTGVGSRIGRIRRDRDAASATYAVLSQRLAKTLADRAEAASTGSVIVADRASYAKRGGSSMSTAIAASLALLVAWLAYGVPLLVESLDRRFRVPENIEEIYGSPILAVVR